MTLSGAMFTDILRFASEFSPSARREAPDDNRVRCQRTAACLAARPTRLRSGVRREADASTRRPWSERRQRVGRHAAALRDGHALHDAGRLASMRARRAAAVRDVQTPEDARLNQGVDLGIHVLHARIGHCDRGARGAWRPDSPRAARPRY